MVTLRVQYYPERLFYRKQKTKETKRHRTGDRADGISHEEEFERVIGHARVVGEVQREETRDCVEVLARIDDISCSFQVQVKHHQNEKKKINGRDEEEDENEDDEDARRDWFDQKTVNVLDERMMAKVVNENVMSCVSKRAQKSRKRNVRRRKESVDGEEEEREGERAHCKEEERQSEQRDVRE